MTTADTILRVCLAAANRQPNEEARLLAARGVIRSLLAARVPLARVEGYTPHATIGLLLDICGEQRALRAIGVDEDVLREAAELHPGADRELVRAFFTYRPHER